MTVHIAARVTDPELTGTLQQLLPYHDPYTVVDLGGSAVRQDSFEEGEGEVGAQHCAALHCHLLCYRQPEDGR